MKRGRKPKPTKLRLIHGSRRPGNPAEPKPSPGIRRQKWLTGDGRRIWERLIPELKRIGLATTIDAPPLGRYCDHLARWIKVKTFLDENNETYQVLDENGHVKYVAQYPQVSIYRNLSLLLIRLEAEFGLTASARSRISVTEPEEKNHDPLANFIARKPKIG